MDVVDRLQAVDVDGNDGEALAAELREAVREHATVADSGEWVGTCQRFGPHVRGRVGECQGTDGRKTLEVLDLQLIHQEVLRTGDGNDPEDAGVVQHRHERAVGGSRRPQHVRDNRPAPLGLKLGDHRFPRRDDRLNMRMLGHRNDLRRTGRAGCIGCSRDRHRRAFDHQDRGAMRCTARRRGQFGRRLGNGRANVGRYEGRAQLMRGPSEHAKGAGHLDAVRDVSGARHVAHGLRARSPNRHGADGLPPDKSVRAPAGVRRRRPSTVDRCVCSWRAGPRPPT